MWAGIFAAQLFLLCETEVFDDETLIPASLTSSSLSNPIVFLYSSSGNQV